MESDMQAKRKLCETLGDAAVAAHSYNKAVDYYNQMLHWAEEGGGEGEGAALVSLAQTLRDAGRCEEALVFAHKELQLCSDDREASRSALFLAELLEANRSSNTEIRESYELALSKAKACEDVSLEVSVLRNLFDYLEKARNLKEAENVRKQLESLSKEITESDSEKEEPDSQEIGADICLDELSDVEIVVNEKGNDSRVSRRNKRGLVVKRNEKGETQLHVACINGNVENVENLISAGHPTNERDFCGWTPLHEAANHGHLEIAKLLLNAGANVNDPGGPRCGGITPLHDAATCGNFSMMYLLMQRGADVTARTQTGETTLDCLEEWHNRAGDLSPSEQSEYDLIHQKLLALVPSSLRRPKKSPKVTERTKNRNDLFDEDTEEDDSVPLERISAAEDYKRTIDSFRNRGGKSVPSGNFATRSKITAPLLDSEQVLMDEWLVDDPDLVATKKTNITDDLPNTTKRKSSNSTPVGAKSSKRQRFNSVDNLQPTNICDEESMDSNASEVIEIVDKPAKVVKRVRQSSLLSAGFSRDSVSRTPSPISGYKPQSTTAYPTQSEVDDLQVCVEDKLFRYKFTIIGQQNRKAASIFQEIMKKFEGDTGCRPSLNLTTQAGEPVLPESTLDVIMPSGNLLLLKSEVIGMDVPSICERYTTICSTCGIDVQDGMMKCLKTCKNTSIFRLNDRDTSDEELVPLLKSLQYENPLRVLHLSGGVLWDLGETLNRCLARLTSLQELHLRGCDIDSDCLIKIEKLPAQLRVLDLGCNPLGPLGVKKLYDLISPLRCLQTLNLRSCKLETDQPGFNNIALANLDVSSNPLGGDGVAAFLQSRMLTLNLSRTASPGKSSVARTLLNGVTFSLQTLECLELSNCNISHTELTEILSQSPNLNRLVVSHNKQLSKPSVIALLQHKPTLSHIDISGCTEINESPDFDVCIDYPESCTLVVSMVPEVQESWLDLWGGRGMIKRLPHHVVIIKPDL